MLTVQEIKTFIDSDASSKKKQFAKVDLFLLMGRITEDEYVELTGMLVEPEEGQAQEEDQPEVQTQAVKAAKSKA